MLKALAKRMKRDEGFTLIELMVVVLIIAILIAIAIPTFLGARSRAQDRQAQSNVKNALSTLDTYFSDQEKYTAASADLEALEPQLDYVTTTGAADAKDAKVAVFVNTADGKAGNMVIIASESQSGTVFCTAKIGTGTNAGTFYAKNCTGGETEATVAGWAKSTDGWK